MTAERSRHRGVPLIIDDSVTFGICVFIWGQLLSVESLGRSTKMLCGGVRRLPYSYHGILYHTVVNIQYRVYHGTVSLSCAHSLYSAEGGTGQCVMPCAVMPRPTLASRLLSPLCRWHVDGLRTAGEYTYACVSERESDFPFLPLKHGCACAHGHMTAPWLWVCEDDKCGVVSHPGLSEHYLTHRRLYLTGHRPRQPASLGFSTYNPEATP